MTESLNSPEAAGTPNATSDPNRQVSLPWAFGLVLLVAVLVFGHHVPQRIGGAFWPHPLDHEEDYVLVHAWRLAHGQWYIQPIDDPLGPYVVGTYMPVFPLLVAAVTGSAEPTLVPGRLLAMCSALACAGLLGALLVRAATPWPMALALAGLFLLHRDTLKWLPLLRVDFTAWMFGLLALWGASRWNVRMCAREHNAGVRLPYAWLVLAGCAAVAAFFTKQTTLAAPAAIFVWLWLHHGVRLAATWALATAATALALMGLCQMLSPGNFFFQTVVANANVMSADQLMVWVRHFTRFTVYLMAAAAVAVLTLIWRRFQRVPDTPTRISSEGRLCHLLMIYAFFSLTTFAGSAKLGAAENYMLEPLMGLLLLVGVMIAREAARWSMPGEGELLRRMAPTGAVWVLLMLHVLHLGVAPPKGSGLPAMPRLRWGVQNAHEEDDQAARFIDNLVRSSPADTWSERATFALRHGAPLFLHPFINAQLAREGKWDEALAVAQIERGRFRRMIITEDVRPEAFQAADAQYTPAMRRAIQQRYELVRAIPALHFTYWIWERRSGG
jgi:hypothetical protein